MKKLLIVVLCFCTSLSFIAQETSFVDGDLIIMLYQGRSPQSILQKTQQVNGVYTGMEIAQTLSDRAGIYLFHFNHFNYNQFEMLEMIREFPEVMAAQFNHYVEDRLTPNDTQYASQWHHNDASDNDIDTPLAWDITTGGTAANGERVVACVVEFGGANYNHTDLAGNHWTNLNETDNDGIDNDGNGRIDDFHGWNVGTNNDNISAGGHGTAVSGMIGSVGNNSLGGAGVNWDVELMQVQAQTLSEAGVIAAYDYPYDMRVQFNSTAGALGAFVVTVNSSWGIDNANPASYPVWCAFYDTMGAAGILNCAATANNNVNIDVVGDMPTGCSSQYLISVTATNSSDVRTFSGYGINSIDLGAPGEAVFLPSGSSAYSSTSGTSFASPCVAGAIALLYSAPCADLAADAITSPAATALLVRDAIYNGVDLVANLATEVATGGRLNVFNALNLILIGCGTGVPGCNDIAACNFDPDATINDGSCTYAGCTDPTACNFNSAAGCLLAGSCCYGNCTTINVTAGTYPSEVSWIFSDPMGNVILSGGAPYNSLICVPGVCGYTLQMLDSFGDGWNGSFFQTIEGGFTTNSITLASGSGGSASIDLGGGNCGCTNPAACNYDPTAISDDGSCIVGASITIDMTDSFGDGWNDGEYTVFDGGGNAVASGTLLAGSAGSNSYCLPNGCYTFSVTGGSFPSEIGWSINGANESPVIGGAPVAGVSFTVGDTSGCMDAAACNYEAGACFDDGSCTYPGCDDVNACNYDALAGCDDGSCTYPGCNDVNACNYDALAGCDDGSCTYPGCDDVNACNYDALAGCDDGSCTYPGCDDVNACNYDALAGCDDGSCTYPGCDDVNACNYDALAGCDDGSCTYPGCDDVNACNYNMLAGCNDGSCTYPGCDDVNACNYNMLAGCDDGSCTFPGCDDMNACNYDGTAGCSDGSCTYPGCTDPGASNYNAGAGCDDGSCTYDSCFGDFDNNGFINTGDLLLLMANFGCLSSCGEFDLDANGPVNTSDLLLFMAVFGTVCP